MKEKGDIAYLLYPPESIRSRGAYNFYKKTFTSHKFHRVNRESPWRKIVTAFWEEAGKGLVEMDGGVFIKGLGYFGIWMSPIKSKQFFLHHTKGYQEIFNDHTDHHVYHPIFMEDVVPNNKLRYWNMDRAFTQTITRKMAKKLRAGKRYKFRYTSIKKIHNSRNIK